MKNYIIAFLVITIFVVIYAFEKNPKITYVPIGKWTITAYQAIKAQCDNSPDYGAYRRVAKNGVPLGHYFACNTLPKDTLIMIPELTGNTIYRCADRMNKRYNGKTNIDILVGKDAVIMGARKSEVFIVLKGDNK